MRTTIFSSVPYKFLAALAIIAMLLAVLPAMPAYAATITVTNTTDDLTADNGCSLREAIINANNNGQPHPDCASGSGLEVDVITLSSGSTHTLSLTGASMPQTGDLDITDAAGLIIQASSTTPAIIDGGDIDRVLDVASGAGNLTLTGITIQNGTATSPFTGGGISFASIATLTLTNSTVSSNISAAAAGCGAGIYNNNGATINIVNSTIADNTCSVAGADGAGLFKSSGGVLNISNSTFFGNSTADDGGAMRIETSTVTITNSTFYNNTAGTRGGAVQVNGATATIEFSTFSGNTANAVGNNGGGAIQISTGSAAINRSILANSAAGMDCHRSAGGTGTITNSLVEQNANCTGTPTSTADPLLGALANNGGPTQTMAITESSPAANVATTCGSITTDQRGVARPQSGVCDLGAFEAPDTTRPTVVSVDAVDANPTSAASVNYTVTFSEPVTGVGESDFTFTTTGGITNVTISGVSGSGTTYTVTVSTGSGDGTLRLDVPVGATIFDLNLNPLGSLPFTGGDVYTIIKPGAWYIAGVGAFNFGTEGDIPVPADYNGDGRAEIAVFRPSNGNWYIAGNATAIVFGQSGDIPVPVDYNGDGRAEIAVFRPSNGNWYIAGNATAIVWGASGDIPVPVDYNGDGRAEIAVFRPSNGNWYIAGNATAIVFGQSGDIPLPVDYNGDGMAEIAVFRPSNGNWYIAGNATAIVWGASGDIPLPVDYNGDGMAEIAVFRPSNGNWYIAGNATAIVWGASGDIPVPADYNGDGMADIAVFRP